MKASFSSNFVGIVQVDVCTRRGNTHFYDLDLQLMTQMPCGDDLDSNQVEIKASMYNEAGPLPEDSVLWASGNFLALAVGFLDISTFGTLFTGDAPETFDPAPGTVVCVGQVISKRDDGRNFTMRVAEYDRRANVRKVFEVVVWRLGKRWENPPPPRVSSVVSVRGSLYDHSAVSQMFSISAESIKYINVATTEAGTSPASPKKRKFVRRNNDDKGKGPGEEPNTSGDNNGEGSSAAASGPATPSSSLGRNKGRKP